MLLSAVSPIFSAFIMTDSSLLFYAVFALCFWFFYILHQIYDMALGSHGIVWTAFRLPTLLMMSSVSCKHLDYKQAIHVWTPVGKGALCYIHKMLRNSQNLDYMFINTIKTFKSHFVRQSQNWNVTWIVFSVLSECIWSHFCSLLRV